MPSAKSKSISISGATAQKRIKNVGSISRKTITKADYTKRITTAATVRGTTGYAYGTTRSGTVFRAHAHGRMRVRGKGAARPALSNVGVTNTAFSTTATLNKSHLAPDKFGGESIPQNLINNTRSQNLKLHKRVENTIGKLVAQNHSNPTPLQRVGSFHIEETMGNPSEKPQSREYHVHIDAGGGNADRYELFKVKYK